MTPDERAFITGLIKSNAAMNAALFGLCVFNAFAFGGLGRMMFVGLAVGNLFRWWSTRPSRSPLLRGLDTATVERIAMTAVGMGTESQNAVVYVKGAAPVTLHLARESERARFMEIVQRLSPSVQLGALAAANPLDTLKKL